MILQTFIDKIHNTHIKLQLCKASELFHILRVTYPTKVFFIHISSRHIGKAITDVLISNIHWYE